MILLVSWQVMDNVTNPKKENAECRIFELDLDSSNRFFTSTTSLRFVQFISVLVSQFPLWGWPKWPAVAFLLHFVMVPFCLEELTVPPDAGSSTLHQLFGFDLCNQEFTTFCHCCYSQTWSKRTKVKEMLHQPLQCRFHHFRCFHLDFKDGVYIYGLFMEGKDLLLVGAVGFGPNLQCNQALCQVHVGTLLLTWCPIAIVVRLVSSYDYK